MNEQICACLNSVMKMFNFLPEISMATEIGGATVATRFSLGSETPDKPVPDLDSGLVQMVNLDDPKVILGFSLAADLDGLQVRLQVLTW